VTETPSYFFAYCLLAERMDFGKAGVAYCVLF
jgi:hypothetical protein